MSLTQNVITSGGVSTTTNIQYTIPPRPTPKFKVGQMVICIKKSNENQNDGGLGWENGLIYKITSVHDSAGCKDNFIYFGGKNGHGVFESWLKLIGDSEEIKRIKEEFLK